MFCCGIASECITPELGMVIPGYFEPRIITGARDDLYAKAVAVSDGNETVTFVACDAINLDPEDILAIRDAVAKKYPEAKVIANATHTHTGGPVWEGFTVHRNAEYMEKLVAAAADAACRAISSMVPAKFGSATGSVENVAFVRRFIKPDGMIITNPPSDAELIGPEGVPDNTFTLYKICDLSGNIIVLMSSFGLHLDTVGGCEVSADYPGIMAQHVKEYYGEGVMSFFSTGPCGNINHINRNDQSSYNKGEITKKIAKVLFEELKRLEPQIELRDEVCVSFKDSKFVLPLRKPSAEALAEARAIISGEIKIEPTSMLAPELFANCLIEVAEDPRCEATFEVSRVKIGDAYFISWPGEIFCDFGMQIREDLVGHDVIISELNGSCGAYIPTKEAFPRGGYEPKLVDKISLCEDGGDIIVAETRKIL